MGLKVDYCLGDLDYYVLFSIERVLLSGVILPLNLDMFIKEDKTSSY